MKKLFLFALLLLAGATISAQVVISGTARNYSDSVFYISEQGGFHPVTQQWRDQRVQVRIDSQGHFSSVIPERGIGSWMIQTAKGHQFFDLVSGQSLSVEADFSRPDPLQVMGENAGDFHFVAWLNKTVKEAAAEPLAVIRRKPGLDSVLAARLALAGIKEELLQQYDSLYHLSDPYAAWLRSQFRYEPYERTLVENISDRDAVGEATIQQLVPFALSDEYAALHTGAYMDLVSFYMYRQFRAAHKNVAPNKAALFQFAQGDLLKGNTREAYLARVMAQFIKDPDSLYVTAWVVFDGLVGNESLKRPLREARALYEQRTATAANVVAGKRPALHEILQKYQGKLVYLDFWASWCAPCRAEMPNAARLKEQLKDEPIVFVYLGYNDQPAAWQKARDQLGIEGEHYLLDSAAIRKADAVFGINGIPHYAIIGPDGNILQTRADRPGAVYAVLLGYLQSRSLFEPIDP